MASEQTPEAKELALVGKVEMRIALASSEKKLEDLLKVYLSPLLLKLGSDSVAVRNKVRPTRGICRLEFHHHQP
jgi:proteasome component ECM29